MRFSRAQGGIVYGPPTALLGRHKENMLVLENHATKPSEIALQESKGYPPKTWPTFNHSKQLSITCRSDSNHCVIDNISPVNDYRSRFNRVIVGLESLGIYASSAIFLFTTVHYWTASLSESA